MPGPGCEPWKRGRRRPGREENHTFSHIPVRDSTRLQVGVIAALRGSKSRAQKSLLIPKCETQKLVKCSHIYLDSEIKGTHPAAGSGGSERRSETLERSVLRDIVHGTKLDMREHYVRPHQTRLGEEPPPVNMAGPGVRCARRRRSSLYE